MKKWIFGFRNFNNEEPGKENELCPVCGLPLNSCICKDEPELKCPNTPECNIVNCSCGESYCSTHETHECEQTDDKHRYVKIKLNDFNVGTVFGVDKSVDESKLYKIFGSQDIDTSAIYIHSGGILNDEYTLIETKDNSDTFVYAEFIQVEIYTDDNWGEGDTIYKTVEAYMQLEFEYDEEHYVINNEHLWYLRYHLRLVDPNNLPSDIDDEENPPDRKEIIPNDDKYDFIGEYNGGKIKIISSNC